MSVMKYNIKIVNCITQHIMIVLLIFFFNSVHLSAAKATQPIKNVLNIIEKRYSLDSVKINTDKHPTSLSHIRPFSSRIDENYTLERTMLNANGTKYIDKIVYYDGLGRPFETALKAASPYRSDIVSYQEYDGAGRQYKVWSPVPMDAHDGCIGQSCIQTASQSFYLDPMAYQEIIYEQSSLDRASYTTGPGQAWYNAGRKVKNNYFTNTEKGSLACVLYTIQDDQQSILNKGFYPKSELVVIQTTDEDDHVNYEFKDKQGRVVLKRVMDGSKMLDTYFVYDDFGRLRYVLPPDASQRLSTANSSWNINHELLQQTAYYYQYDRRGNCVIKKLPGCKAILMKYDMADRLIFSQDGNQYEKKEWSLFLYDAFGRHVISAVCKLQTVPDVSNMVVLASFTGSGAIAGYTVNLNFTPIYLTSVDYYDDYRFINSLSTLEKVKMQYNAMVVGYDKQYTGGAKGLLTGKRIYSLDASDKYTITSYYYDDYGRMVQVHASNHLGGFEDEYTAYNFPGTIRQKLHIHTVPNKPVQREVYSYTYDHVNRLLTTSHKLNDLPERILLSNSYDEIGRLQEQSKATETSVYTYNVRDWLTGISGKFFSETLAYNTAVGGISPQVASYSGNISAMQWKAGMEKVMRGYQFRYDHINRLTHALYGEGNNITINDKYNEILTYDLMGNILTLRRHGKHDSGFGLIDKLAYKYNGNQLIKVTDAATTSVTSYGAFQFVDGADVENEYVYDANGNMTEDFNKKISKIEYNLLNLPSKLQFSFGHMAEYSYDGAGRKLSVTYKTSKTNLFVPMGSIVPPLSTNVALTLKTDYCGNMIYENGQLSKILTDVGYITLANSTPTYHYYLQDHLGNNRVVIDEHGQVEQVNHYYAFGGLMGESTGGGAQPYKYNGKELDRMHGLDWYDYGARHYDAVLGRWMCVDPLAEKYDNVGSYIYCKNNPIAFMDMNGKDGVAVIDYENHSIIINQKFYYIVNDDLLRRKAVFKGAGGWKSDFEINSDSGWGRMEGFKVSYNQSEWNVKFNQEFIGCSSMDEINQHLEQDKNANAIVGNKDFHGRSGDAAGEYNPANRIITLGEGVFKPNNKGQTLQHEIGHSWGLEHDHEMGISMPEKDPLGRDSKEGGIMTSAQKRSISPQEVSYGIRLILQAVPNNHSSKVTVNIHVDRNYEIQK